MRRGEHWGLSRYVTVFRKNGCAVAFPSSEGLGFEMQKSGAGKEENKEREGGNRRQFA